MLEFLRSLLFEGIVEFVYWYPAMMAMMWVLGSIIFYRANERKGALPLKETPFVSILMPAHNESDILYNVVEEMTKLNYPDYEIILINDGSTDDTGEVLKNIVQMYDKVRVIDLKPNCGKANALYLGLIASKGEILVGVDADSYLDKNALRYLVSHFVNENNGERVGAVTGNPRVRNRGSLLGKLQLCEYASIISLIKRTQRVLGKVMTVSGVCVAYRKKALLECGFWDRDMMTEDIAVTWKLEKNFWDVRYEPRALCWMLVPETVKGLWRQRKRWAEGGLEVIFRHWDIFKNWQRRRMVPVYLEQICSFFWSVCWLILTLILLIMEFTSEHVFLEYLWKSQFLSFVCLFQFAVAIWLEAHYDKNILKSTWSVIWYPLIYWYVNVFITLAALFKAILPKKKLATWKSPDRGITASAAPKKEVTVEVKKDHEKTFASYDDIKVSRLVQAFSANPENADVTSPLVDGTLENPVFHSNSTEHIEEKTKKKKIKRVLEVILTVIAWAYMLVYWAFMIYGIFCDVTGREIYEFWLYNHSTINQTEHFFDILFITALVEILVLIVWKEYNYHRFGKLKRRKFKPDVANEELDEFFELEEDIRNAMHNDKYIILYENPIPEGIGQGRRLHGRNRCSALDKRSS
ncbi:MAG: poly-beta-1,6 N-acetyl-D-glucosamine synthase [Clostridiales bacterium]|nr:poly-beta-1,6 N-acetyl-D-glucosamine synthase [Clostridiales bacterium]